jgi:hypothetical protein
VIPTLNRARADEFRFEGATVHVGYDDPRELAGRYDVEANRPTLVEMAAPLEALAAAATGPRLVT